MSRMSFEPIKHSVNRSISLDRKVIRYKIKTVSEPIYKDKLVKNMTMGICYEATSTNSNSISIPMKVCLKGCNKYELCVYIDSVCSVCFEKILLFSEFI